MEATRLHGFGELHRVTRAVDVGDLLSFGAGGEVVHRRQMEEVPDLALELFQVGIVDAEVLLAEVADDADHLLFVGTPILAQRVELLRGCLADQDVDRLSALQQVRDQKSAYESGCAGDKVRHGFLPCVLR